MTELFGYFVAMIVWSFASALGNALFMVAIVAVIAMVAGAWVGLGHVMKFIIRQFD